MNDITPEVRKFMEQNREPAMVMLRGWEQGWPPEKLYEELKKTHWYQRRVKARFDRARPFEIYKLEYEVPNKDDEGGDEPWYRPLPRYYMRKQALVRKVNQIQRDGGHVLAIRHGTITWD